MFDMEEESLPDYIGTEGFMAPELSYGQADPRSDIYSIGAILYAALVKSEKPDEGFAMGEGGQLGQAVRDSVLLKELEIPGRAFFEDSITVILRNCLSYDRSRRYRSCGELKKALTEAREYLYGRKSIYHSEISRKANSAVAIQRLLLDHPLYSCVKSDTEELRLAVIGDSTWSRRLLDLSLGVTQNLRNPLRVVMYAKDGENASFRYRSLRPALTDFFRVDGRFAGGGHTPYGELLFRDLPAAKQLGRRLLRDGASWLFISLETDARSLRTAMDLARVIGKKADLTIACVYQGDGTLKPADIPQETADEGIVLVRVMEENRVRRSVEEMAFQVYLTWRGDNAGNIREERKSFREKYQYISSVANAVSIRYKLWMLQAAGFIGEGRSRRKAACELRACIDSETFLPVLDEMAMREHRRWNTEKITEGWRGIPSACEALYYQRVSDSGEVRDRKRKIHPCIAYGEQGMPLAGLSRARWDGTEPLPGCTRQAEATSVCQESGDESPARLDALDLVSVSLHRALLKSAPEQDAFASNHGLYCDYKKFDYDLIRAIPDILEGTVCRKESLPEYHPCPADIGEIVLPEALAGLTELLAENVHATWAEGLMKDGWRYGPRKDERRKRHPNLVPYDQLPESEKDVNRNTVRTVLKLLLKMGFNL